MSCLAVSDKFVAVAKGLHVDCYDHSKNNIIDVAPLTTPKESDYVVDVILSSDDKYLAVMTSSKELLVFNLPISSLSKRYTLPRSASKARFSVDNSHIFIADKSGDALIYDIKSEESNGVKILGHLSLLLDILQTNDGKYIVTSDRDEKIKVSSYPNTYNIQTYCLGHKEFVNHIELLPHNAAYLLSSSGDGTVKIWNHTKGTICHTIDTNIDVNESHLKNNFIKSMDEDGVHVNALPIVHCAVTLINDISIVAVTIYTYNKILIYSVHTNNEHFNHKLQNTLTLKRFPSAIQFNKASLFVYDEFDARVQIYKCSDIISFETEINMFKEQSIVLNLNSKKYDLIKILYKRKFDNVQEYHERKKQRLENAQ